MLSGAENMHECHIKWDSTTCDMQFNGSNIILNRYDDYNISLLFDILSEYERLSYECKPILWDFFESAYIRNDNVEYFRMDLNKLKEFMYPYISKYYNNNTDDPAVIIIGKLLKQCSTRYDLPNSRLIFTIKDLYKILYIPEFSGVLILNKTESELINAR